jgi:hypothetical protein
MRIIICIAILITCAVLTMALWRVLSATEAAIAAAELTITEAQAAVKQAKLAIVSAHGLTFDLRKNWTSNTTMQTETMERLLSSLERTTRASEMALARSAVAVESVTREASDTVADMRMRLIPAVEGAICEASTALRGVGPVLAEATATIAAVRPVLDTARAGVEGIATESRAAVADTRTILRSTDAVVGSLGAIAQSGAAVAAHYEKMILHPSWSQRLKGVLQLVLSGFTVWGNAKLIF